MNNDKQVSLEFLKAQLQGAGMGMPLSKFVELNLPILKEFKKFHVPLKTQVLIIEDLINKPVSVSSLSVALSRLNNVNNKDDIVFIDKKISERFVPKSSKLTLGGQKERIKEINTKNGIRKTEEKEILIDWRGLSPNENISSWILEYKEKLIAINLTGWRWKQITEAINEHLNLQKKISVNTLTSIISLSNKRIINN